MKFRTQLHAKYNKYKNFRTKLYCCFVLFYCVILLLDLSFGTDLLDLNSKIIYTLLYIAFSFLASWKLTVFLRLTFLVTFCSF